MTRLLLFSVFFTVPIIAGPPPAPLVPVHAQPPPVTDKTTFEYWIAACETISREYGDDLESRNFRIGSARVAYAHAGRFDEALAHLDALRSADRLTDLGHGHFLTEVGELLVAAGRLDKAVALLPRIMHSRLRHEFALRIAENCVAQNRPDLARPAIQSADEALEHYVNTAGGMVLEPINRCTQFASLATAAFDAGLPAEAAAYVRRAEEFIPRSIPQTAFWLWSTVGVAYAHIGDLANAERALINMTARGNKNTDNDSIASAACDGWKTAIARRVNRGDPDGARRLLDAGRKTLGQAARDFTFITPDDVAANLSDACLQKDPFTSLIAARRPDDALKHYAAKGGNLRLNADEFHAILDLFLDAGRLDDARRMLDEPKLGFHPEPGNQEDASRIDDMLAVARSKLAAALLVREGPPAQEAYVASLGDNLTPRTRFEIALQSAYATAEKQKPN